MPGGLGTRYEARDLVRITRSYGGAMHVAGFGNPWEHARLLSDARRNQAYLQMLERRAPGARVLEAGCGSGLLSVIAARLGAREVHAVEPTGMAAVARELVRVNRLQHVVTVHESMLEELEPRPVDVAFFELFNADPFVEGIMSVSEAARHWLVPDGVMAPRRLLVRAALTPAAEPADEVAVARREVQRLASAYGLELGLLAEALGSSEASKEIGRFDVVGSPVTLWDLDLTQDELPEDEVAVRLVAPADMSVGGVVVWFEAELDDGVCVDNRPGQGGHWSQLYSGFSMPVPLTCGAALDVVVELDEDELEVRIQ